MSAAIHNSGGRAVTVTIYHNPRCSKSRQTLALLNERGVEINIIEYLQASPDAATFAGLLDGLGLEPSELMRKKEAPYRDLGLDDPGLDRSMLIAAMIQNPVLIERPIVVPAARVALGRPPEAVLEIL